MLIMLFLPPLAPGGRREGGISTAVRNGEEGTLYKKRPLHAHASGEEGGKKKVSRFLARKVGWFGWSVAWKRGRGGGFECRKYLPPSLLLLLLSSPQGFLFAAVCVCVFFFLEREGVAVERGGGGGKAKKKVLRRGEGKGLQRDFFFGLSTLPGRGGGEEGGGK